MLTVFGVGLAFSVIYFVVFRFVILKWDIKTPGREEETDEVKMYSKKDYKDKKANEKSTESSGDNEFNERAKAFLIGLGGSNNIDTINNCATRLRVSVEDPDMVKDNQFFTQNGAHGFVHKGKSTQVIVGLDAMQLREEFEEIVQKEQDS